MRLVIVFAFVLLKAAVAQSADDYVMFGVRNPSSVEDPAVNPDDPDASNFMTGAINSWLWSPVGAAVPLSQQPNQQQQQGIFALQSVPMFFSRNPTRIDKVVKRQLQTLLAVWRNSTVPVIVWHPAVDYNEEPEEFVDILVEANGQYNEYLINNSIFDAYVTAFVTRVLVPFLSGDSVDGPRSARRVFVEFAPEANTLRFPWGLQFAFNGTTSQGHNTIFRVNQSAASYRRLWERLVGSLVVNSTALGQVADAIPFPTAPTHDKLQLVLQLIWTLSSCRTNGAVAVEELLPSWRAGEEGYVYGPTWFGVSAVVIPDSSSSPASSSSSSSSTSSGSPQLPSPPSSVFEPVLQQMLRLASTANATLRRIANLTGSPIPVAITSLGATALNDALYPLNSKSQWIADALGYLVWGAADAADALASRIHMVVYDNSLYYNGSFSWRHAQDQNELKEDTAHLQILSFHDFACCPDEAAFVLPNGTTTTASACDAVRDKLVELVFGARPVAYLPQQAAEGIVSDGAFLGAGTVSLPPIPAWAPSSSDGENMLQHILHHPLAIASAAVIGAILLALFVWRLVSRHRQLKAARLILQRYSCTRIMRRRKGPESAALVEAIDMKQNQKVVVKQFVLVSDHVNALANNEIDKLRAAQGSDHVVQLVQTAFAWKSNRVAVSPSGSSQRGSYSATASRKAFSEADIAEDSSPMLARVQYKSRPQPSAANSSSAAKNYLAGTETVLNDGNSDRFPYALIVTKKYSSGDLEQLIRLAKARRAIQDSPYTGVPIHDALSIFAQLLRALHFIHHVAKPKDPILHRDVKPENIFLERRKVRGEKDQWAYLAFLGDFGFAVYRSQLAQAAPPRSSQREVAATSDESGTSEGTNGPKVALRASTIRAVQQQQQLDAHGVPYPDSSFGVESASTYLGSKCIGTRRFMPPEARRGEYCSAGDVYSAGCVLLAMLLADLPDDISLATQSPALVQKMRAELARDANCPQWLVTLLFDQILLSNPAERPTALFVLAQLKSRMSKRDQLIAGISQVGVPEKETVRGAAHADREAVLDLSADAQPTAAEIDEADRLGEPIAQMADGESDEADEAGVLGILTETVPCNEQEEKVLVA